MFTEFFWPRRCALSSACRTKRRWITPGRSLKTSFHSRENRTLITCLTTTILPNHIASFLLDHSVWYMVGNRVEDNPGTPKSASSPSGIPRVQDIKMLWKTFPVLFYKENQFWKPSISTNEVSPAASQKQILGVQQIRHSVLRRNQAPRHQLALL